MSEPKLFVLRDRDVVIRMAGVYPYLDVRFGDQSRLVYMSQDDMLRLIECVSQRYAHAVALHNKKANRILKQAPRPKVITTERTNQ